MLWQMDKIYIQTFEQLLLNRTNIDRDLLIPVGNYT